MIKNTLSDLFRVADYETNWNILDDFPGVFICTSATRPTTWGALQEGLAIFETDTLLLWHWTGAAFSRVVPKGAVGYQSTTTPFETASLSYVTAITASVTVAAGGRRHLVIAEGPGVYNTNGLTLLSLWRGATMLQEWKEQGATGSGATVQPRPLSMTTTDTPNAGAESYTLQVKADSSIGGTSTLQAGANKPLALTVVEI